MFLASRLGPAHPPARAPLWIYPPGGPEVAERTEKVVETYRKSLCFWPPGSDQHIPWRVRRYGFIHSEPQGGRLVPEK